MEAGALAMEASVSGVEAGAAGTTLVGRSEQNHSVAQLWLCGFGKSLCSTELKKDTALEVPVCALVCTFALSAQVNGDFFIYVCLCGISCKKMHCTCKKMHCLENSVKRVFCGPPLIVSVGFAPKQARGSALPKKCFSVDTSYLAIHYAVVAKGQRSGSKKLFALAAIARKRRLETVRGPVIYNQNNASERLK
jgi:hypothetical protein